MKSFRQTLNYTLEYILNNGVRLMLHPFDSTSIQCVKRQNRLSFHGFTNKGIGCYPRADYFSAMNSVEIVRNSGVGDLDKYELKRYLSQIGFNGQISPYITYNKTGIRGSTSFKELETALQLVYLYFTAPNSNERAFEDWKMNTTSSHNLSSINADDFRTSVRTILKDSTFLPMGTKALEGISKTDMEKALAICREIHGNAEDFTFVFTGDFPEDKVLSLCRKYLGNLPVEKAQKNCDSPITSKRYTLPRPLAITVPAKEHMQEVKVKIVYASKLGVIDLDWKEEAKSRLLQRLMDFSIAQKMRYNSDEGGTYHIGVGLNPEKSRLFNEIFVQFSSSIEEVDRLIAETKQVITSFKNSTVDVELLKEYKNADIHYLEKEKDSRKYIFDKIYDYYKFEKPWHSIEEEQEFIKSLIPEDIKKTAQRLLKVKPFEFKMVSTEVAVP